MVSDSSENDIDELAPATSGPSRGRRVVASALPAARPLVAGLALAALLGVASAAAADDHAASTAPPADRAAGEPERSDAAAGDDSTPAPGAESPEPAASAPRWRFAAGLFVNYGPTYSGSADSRAGVDVGFYIRRGRWALTNRSDLITRRGEEVVHGLSSDVVDRSNLRVAAGLRIDRGRGLSSEPALAGLDKVPATLRLRLVADSRFPGPWQGSVSGSFDLLRRGAGNTLAFRVWRNLELGADKQFSISAGIDGGDARFLQNWYGITESESARTGYPVYLPGAGLSQAILGANLRQEIDLPWVVFASGGVSTLIGPARSSPLTHRTTGWSVNVGVGREF